MKQSLFIFTLIGFITVTFGKTNSLFQHEGKSNGGDKIRFQLETIPTNKSGEYTRFSLLNNGTTTEEGMPELPMFTTSYQIDPRIEYSVEYSVVSSHIEENVSIFPYQGNLIDPLSMEVSDRNLDFYSSDASYPVENLIVSERQVMRDIHLITISVIPYSYNPELQQLEVFDEIEISVNEVGPTQNSDFEPRPKSRAFEKLYSNMVVNYDLDMLSSEYQQPAVLYVCGGSSESNNSFEDLVEWRRQRGYIVYTASLSETGSSTSSIKNYITNAYNNYDPPPEFVSFVGDVGGSYDVPTYYEEWGHNTYGNDCEGDQPYAQLDGSDLFPEVFVGRISVRSSSDLSTISSKIINYEKATYLSQISDYYEKAAMAGDPSSSGNSCAITKEYVKEVMEQHGMTDVRIKTSGQSWPSWMVNQLEEGVLYFNYRGYLGISGFGNGDVDDANNGYKLPFASLVTCGPGSFAEDQTSLTEKLLRAGNSGSPKGAVAACGTATWNTHTLFNNILDMGIYDGLFSDRVITAGAALASGKLALLSAYPTNPDNWVSAFTQWNNLMGDPATHLFTDTPKILNVAYSSSINYGTDYVDFWVTSSVGIPVEDALVSLWKESGNVSEIAYADDSGMCTIPLDDFSYGTIDVTVTAENCQPFTGSLSIVSNAVNLTLVEASTVIDDSDGNSDGLLNPGETVEVQLAIQNFGSSTANNVTATLLTTSPFVTINESESTYGSIFPGISSYGTPFSISLASSAVQDSDLELRVLITTGIISWTHTVSIQVQGSNLVVSGFTVSGGGDINPGDVDEVYVLLQNVGSVRADNVTADITYSGDLINILSGDVNWGDIDPGVSLQSQNTAQVAVNPNVINGTVVSLSLHISGDDGYNRTETLSFEIGEVSVGDPLGPDEYGYYIYDSGDTAYDLAPDYNWIEIDPGYGGSGSPFNFYDPGNGDWGWENENPPVSTVSLPFTFQFYGIEYNSISVCSNGWLSFGESDMGSFRNYPIPGAGGPPAMVAAFWDDLVTDEGGGGDAFIYNDPNDEYVVVEWSDMRTENNSSIERFEVILYNNASLPHGDGDIKIQYKTFNNTSSGEWNSYPPKHGSYSTIGIENHLGDVGLQYTFDNSYPEAAMTLSNNDAIFITTQPSVAQTSTTITNVYQEGWNMVGLGASVDDNSLESVFPDGLNGTFYSYDNTYIPETTVEMGKGYWLRFGQQSTNSVSGTIVSYLTIPVVEGWNMIAGPSATSAISDPDNVVWLETLYEFDVSYIQASELEPGKGYWIRASGDGNIIVSEARFGRISSTEGTDALDQFNSIRFTNSHGAGSSLYFGSHVTTEENVYIYSFPPVPPAGSFDIRFAGDLIASESGGEILIQNDHWPLIVEWTKEHEIGNWVLVDEISGTEYVLSENGTVEITESTERLTLYRNTLIPEHFALYQNYPNPFNPVTTIRFDLAEVSEVSLKVFDLTGREVAELVNGRVMSGSYSVEWDASDASSGIYIYKLTLGERQLTKKMVMLK